MMCTAPHRAAPLPQVIATKNRYGVLHTVDPLERIAECESLNVQLPRRRLARRSFVLALLTRELAAASASSGTFPLYSKYVWRDCFDNTRSNV